MKWKELSLTCRPQPELGGQNELAVACKLSGFDVEVAGGENKKWEIKNSLFLLCFPDCNFFFDRVCLLFWFFLHVILCGIRQGTTDCILLVLSMY